MKTIFLILIALYISACSSFPQKRILEEKYLSNQLIPNEKYDDLKKKLSVGVNNVTAGYSAEVTLLTESLLTAEATEKGKKNMDSEQVTQKNIKEQLELFTKDKTCFSFSIHTYSLPEAKFSNWVGKLKDSGETLKEITFNNTTGVQSVPSTYQDIHGRNWHNFSFGCTSKIEASKGFKVYLIPQLKTNATDDGKTEFTWELKK